MLQMNNNLKRIRMTLIEYLLQFNEIFFEMGLSLLDGVFHL